MLISRVLNDRSLKLFVFCTLVILTNLFVCCCYSQSDTAQSNRYFKVGMIEYQKAKYLVAVNNFNLAIKFDTNNWKAYRSKADAERKLRKNDLAVIDYNYALKISKNDGLVYYGLAESKRFLEDYDSAIKYYSLALKEFPKDESIYFGRANSYRGLNNYKEALSDYNKFIELTPFYAAGYLQRGIVLNKLEKFIDAIRDFNHYIKLCKSDPSKCYYYRGYSYGSIGKTDSAIIDLENYFKKYPKWSQGLQVLGTIYAESKNIDMARKYFKESIQLDSNNLQTYFSWGSHEISQGDIFYGKQLLVKVFERTKNPTKELYYYMGMAEALTADTLKALKYFNKALDLDDKYKDVYNSRIDFLAGNSKYDYQLILDISNLIRITSEPSSLSELYALRAWLNGRRNDFVNAFADIDRAIFLYPEKPSNYLYKAWMIFNSNIREDLSEKELKSATTDVIIELDKAIKINDREWRSFILKAYTYQVVKDYQRACVNLRMGIKLGANISKEQEDYICKGKLPKDGKVQDLKFYLTSPKINK